VVIDSFSGEYRFLSNFWSATVELDGMVFPSVEHAYQAAKTNNTIIRQAMAYMSAAEAKKTGRNLDLRPGWEDMKVEVMRQLLVRKFTHPDLCKQLLDTGDAELIEGNTWGDIYWGVCKGRGKNMLGKLLMEIRANIRRTHGDGT
jgi:ribA/ribD-fused uncharacterized protein